MIAGSVWGFYRSRLMMCVAATQGCLRERMAELPLTPSPDTERLQLFSRHAMACGIVSGSARVASDSQRFGGTRISPRYPRSFPWGVKGGEAARPRAALPGGARGRSSPGRDARAARRRRGAQGARVARRESGAAGWGAALTLIARPPLGSRRRPAPARPARARGRGSGL